MNSFSSISVIVNLSDCEMQEGGEDEENAEVKSSLRAHSKGPTPLPTFVVEITKNGTVIPFI